MYLPNHAQLMQGQIMLLPNSAPGGTAIRSESTSDTQAGVRINRMSMSPHALASSQIRDYTAAKDHIFQDHQLPRQNLHLPRDTSHVSSTSGTNQTQTGSNRNCPQKPEFILINPGHISSDGVKPGRSLEVSYFQVKDTNDSILVDQTKASGYHHRSTEEPTSGKRLPEQHVSYSGLEVHSSGAFHVVPRSEGNDPTSSGSSNSGLNKPTLTIILPPVVPILLADRGKAVRFPASQQYGHACNGGSERNEGPWLSPLQNEQHEGQRSLQRQQQQQLEPLRSLQEQEEQQQKYERQKSLQQQEQPYQQQTSLQLREQQYEHQLSSHQGNQLQIRNRRLQLEQQNQQTGYQRSLQQQEQQYEHQSSLQKQDHKYENQLKQQDILQQQQFRHHRSQQPGQQNQQYEHHRSKQQTRNQHMISNHSETTSPFGIVNHFSQDHNSHQRHYYNDQHHYSLQQQHSNFQSASSHLHLRSSASSPTSSASPTMSKFIPEAKPGTRNIPVILISSPPPQEQNRTQTNSPHSSLLSPKSLEEAPINSRPTVATLSIPPFHTSHRHSRSANTTRQSRPSNLSKPCPPPRPMNLSRPDLPPRPMNLSRPDPPPRPRNISRYDSPPFVCRYVDFQPIDKPQQTDLAEDTLIDKTPPPAQHRKSSSLQLPPISLSPEERTSPIAIISPTIQKYSSNHHYTSRVSSSERPACVGEGSASPQLPACYLNSAYQEERTSSQKVAACIPPTLQKPLPHRQDTGHKPPTPISLNSYNLQLPSSHQDLLFVPPKENKSPLTLPKRLSSTLHISSHLNLELSRQMPVESPELAFRTPAKPQRPKSYHGDIHPLSIHERPQPPAPPARISSTKPSSHNRDMSRSLPSITVSSQELSLTIPSTLHSQSKEDMTSSTSHVTSPRSVSTNDRSSPLSRDIKQPTFATVEDLSNIRLKPIGDSCTRARVLNPASPGEVTSGSVNYRLRPTSGRFSNIYMTEKTTLPSRPLADEFDELPPPPPPHELVLSPEDLAVLAADSDRPHQHTGSSSNGLPKLQAHVPAGELNSSQIYHQHTQPLQLRQQPIRPPTHRDNFIGVAGTASPGNYNRAEDSGSSLLERSLTENMSNVDFDIPDDIDLSQCPGLVEITKSTPNWKRDMIEKKNQEKIEEYVKKILKEREQEAKWKNIPEWKKKILQKKEDEEAPGTSATPETTAGSKKPEIKAELKKPAKKPPPPPPKDIKEDYSSLKPKGDIVPAALSIDPEELAAMPPWKRELLFKRDKVPVTFSNEFNPEEDSAADNDKTTS